VTEQAARNDPVWEVFHQPYELVQKFALEAIESDSQMSKTTRENLRAVCRSFRDVVDRLLHDGSYMFRGRYLMLHMFLVASGSVVHAQESIPSSPPLRWPGEEELPMGGGAMVAGDSSNNGASAASLGVCVGEA
jgi:hypothetical protein